MVSNLVLYKIGWASCVLLGATQWHLIGTAIVVLICIATIKAAENSLAVAKLVAAAAVIGFAWESVLSSTGVLQYQYGQVVHPLAPHWIVAMWALFACTFDSSMAWLKKNLALAAAFGAIGGPIAFFAGQKLGAVVIPNDASAIVILASGWALLTPSLVLLSNYFNREKSASKRGFSAQAKLG